MSIKIDMRQVVLLLAGAVDLVVVDDLLHGRRVAVLAVQCARQLGWDQETQNLLFDAGLLHDLGVSSSRVHRNLVQEQCHRAALGSPAAYTVASLEQAAHPQ